jgi:phosphohistidine phosphatase
LELYILRHGKAQDHGLAAGDFRRDLTVAGRAEVEEIAVSIRALNLRLDTMATSPLNRAKQTAQIVSKRLKLGRPEEWDELKPEAYLSNLYRRIAPLGIDSRIMLVGHEPLLSGLMVDVMAGGERVSCDLALKKAGLAKLTITHIGQARLSGSLNWLLTPKLLRKIS